MTEKRITPKAPEAGTVGTDHAAARVTKTSAKKLNAKKLNAKKLNAKKLNAKKMHAKKMH